MDSSGNEKEDIRLPKRPHSVEKPTSPVRTFSTDLAHAVRKDEMSVIKAAMEEEKRRHEEELAKSPGSTRNKTYIILSIVIILLTIAGIAVTNIIKKNRTPDIIENEVKIPSLISSDATTSIEIGGVGETKFIELTKTAVANVSGPENGIINIYYTNGISGVKQLIETKAFFAGINSKIPEALLSTLGSNFMLGVYTKDGVHHPFLIAQTNDYTTAFASMFYWERDLFSDFHQPFNLPADEDTFAYKFTDLLVENKDTRILVKDDGNIAMLYSFADEKTIVITDGVDTFKEILHRLQSVR
jgi:hypothetical protein